MPWRLGRLVLIPGFWWSSDSANERRMCIFFDVSREIIEEPFLGAIRREVKRCALALGPPCFDTRVLVVK